MPKKYCQFYHDDARGLISNKIEVARGFFSRLRGLLGRKGLDKDEGLLLVPCSSIHCFGMRFSIDAIFLDKHYRVVAIHADMKPGTMASHRNARYVLELKAGEAKRHNIDTGEQLNVIFKN